MFSSDYAVEPRNQKYVQRHGIKKGFFIEQALLYHLQMLENLPVDVMIPPRLVISQESGQAVLDKLEQAPQPTKAMQDLFADD